MPLIKMGPAARRARMGSANTIRRALHAAGVPLVTLSPGVFAVEEADLNRFLQNRSEAPPPPPSRPRIAGNPTAPEAPGARPKNRKRRQ